MRKYAVESIGTFSLVFTIVTSVLSGSPLAVLAIGGALLAMVYAGGHISGAHFNPAVSVAALIRGRMDASDMAGYLTAQLAGSAAAAVVGQYVTGSSGSAVAFTGAQVGPALVVEFLFTFALVWVVLNVATSTDTEGNSFYGLAIAFIVVAGAVSVGAISGGAFNPAVALGASISGLFAWGNIWVYLLADLLGGVAAAYAFKALNPTDK